MHRDRSRCTLEPMKPSLLTAEQRDQVRELQMAQDQGIAPIARALDLSPASYNAETREFDVVMAVAGAEVLRYDWIRERVYVEILSFAPGAVRLDRMNAGASLLANHSSWSLSSVIGRIVPNSVKLEGTRLVGRGRLSKRDDLAGLRTDFADGILDKASIGYRVFRWESTRRDDGMEVRTAVDWEPYELSLVTINADAGATVRGAFDPAQILNAAASFASRTLEPMTTSTNTNTNTTPETRSATPNSDQVAAAAVARELERSNGIRDLARRHGLGELGEQLARNPDVTIDAARARFLDEIAARSAAAPATNATNAAASAQVTRSEGEHLERAIENALLHRLNPQRYALNEEGRSMRGLSLVDMLREVGERAGVRTRGLSRDDVIREGLKVRAGAHATADFAAITENVYAKALRDQYQETPDTTAGWTRRVFVPDFKTNSRVQLGALSTLTEVPEGAGIEYKTLGESKESYAVKTYASGFVLTRQLIRNDDLNAFARAVQLMGAAARRIELDLVYFGVINANPAMADGTTLFHASAHGANLLTASLALGSLDLMRQAMRNQTGQAGENLNLEPKFLIVSVAKETTAFQLCSAEILPNAVTGANPFKGTLTPIVEPRLGNTAQGGTANGCVLAAAPGQIDTIEIGNLEGSNGPLIASMVDFESQGVKFGCWHDVAAKAIDWRGLVKNTGTT